MTMECSKKISGTVKGSARVSSAKEGHVTAENAVYANPTKRQHVAIEHNTGNRPETTNVVPLYIGTLTPNVRSPVANEPCTHVLFFRSAHVGTAARCADSYLLYRSSLYLRCAVT